MEFFRSLSSLAARLSFTLLIPWLATWWIVGLAEGKEPPSEKGRFSDRTASYHESIEGQSNRLEMVPLRGGEFLMGSPADEAGRQDDEGPQRKIRVDGFWMGKHEVTWKQFGPYLTGESREVLFTRTDDKGQQVVDSVTRPTAIAWHVNVLTLGMEDQQPVAGITQHTAKVYCQWLSAKTGRYYRLPTEAEWEYACRAGTETSYSFGNLSSSDTIPLPKGSKNLADYAWYAPNAYDADEEGYRPVGQKKPNAWGLHDMHGNVAEWVLDGYQPDAYAQLAETKAAHPWVVPTSLYPRVTRGGSWKDDPPALRSAARLPSNKEWKEPDPSFPLSIWFHRSGEHVGFRIIRPFDPPNAEERKLAASDKHQQ